MENHKFEKFQILPPKPDCCRICAVNHDVDYPHDATSFYYRFIFKNQYNRDATWADAMLHCPEEIRIKFTEYLTKIGIDITSTDIFGGIASQSELEERLEAQFPS